MLSSNVVAESIPTETASYTRGVVVVSIHLLDGRPSTYGTHLADGKMAESADELLFVQSVGRLLHAADEGHLLVPLEQALLRDLDIEAGRVCPVPAEGVLMEPDRERLGVRRVLLELRRVCSGLDRPREWP